MASPESGGGQEEGMLMISSSLSLGQFGQAEHEAMSLAFVKVRTLGVKSDARKYQWQEVQP